ncbi:UNVERIFIED_CONTAM: Calmodulin-binding transcription activator 2 [Sesamum calycinum]|uniref:Calmodulin-binding transcription activator 2 n=1 Tax=Sesamum calycinum TaxID=2727403 RepID=A0AAW2KM37_9LAMI
MIEEKPWKQLLSGLQFQLAMRKQQEEYGDGEFGMSDERALSPLALKTKKAGRHDEPLHATAAHVRGHQVRRNYGKIIWSVGILDKVVLRWRWKRRRLSRFRPEALGAGISMVDAKRKEDDYYFLKEGRKGRKQTEGRLQNALARLTSIVQYSEARDQHRWLLNVV